MSLLVELLTVCDAVESVVHTLPEGKGVGGVTLLDNLLYVLSAETSQQISVYDTEDFYRLQRRINVPQLDSMSDMTACAHNVCIFLVVVTNVYIE